MAEPAQVEGVTSRAVELAQVATQAMPPAMGNDPIVDALKWIGMVIALALAAGLPIMAYIRKYNQTKVENASDAASVSRAGAESVLYSHLSEQVREYRTIADQAFVERNELLVKVTRLEDTQKRLDEALTVMERLKDRLEMKDAEIRTLLQQGSQERQKFLEILQAKDTQIASRDNRISQLESDLRDLRERLLADERGNTFVCPFRESQRIPDPPAQS